MPPDENPAGSRRGGGDDRSAPPRRQRLALWEVMLLVAGAAVGLWLVMPSFNADHRAPGRWGDAAVVGSAGVLGGLALLGPPLLLAELRRTPRVWGAGKLLWFSTGMSAWLLWPPVVYRRVKGGGLGDSTSFICFAYERLTVLRHVSRFGTMIAHPSLGNHLREIMIMAKPLLPDELWEVIEPLLPKWTPSPKGGQPPVTDRAALTGILFVLKTGIPWEDLPCEMNCGCGMTCWRRLRDWQADGTWDKIHKVLLDRLRGADKIDWSRALVDSSFVRAAYGGGETGPSPVDRAKPGSKHHVITDASGIPLASSVTAANVNDITQLAPLFNKIPPVAGKVGHPRKKPDAVQGDQAYDSEPHRQGLRDIGVEPVLPEKGIDDQSGLGETRWPVERTLAWEHQNRRLRIRYERRPDIHQAFLTLACIKICASALFAGFC